MASDRKVFSEQEVTAVVRRAVQLQEQGGMESYTPGVTPEELSRIASEIGIEPKYLQQAISEATAPDSKVGPLHLTEEFERVVDHEIPPEDYDVLLKYLRRDSHRHTVQQIGKTLTGQAWTGCSLANVEVTGKKGRTKVKVKSNGIFAWLVTLHPAFLATMVMLPVLAKSGLIWLAMGILLFVWTLAAILFKTLLHKGHAAARKLADNMAGTIAETAADSPRERLANQPSPVEQTTTAQVQSST